MVGRTGATHERRDRMTKQMDLGGSFTDPRLSGERVDAQVSGSIPCTTDASGD